MLLSDCNIQELVTEQVNKYLKETSFTFDELKALITSKAPIPEVQTHCRLVLLEAKNNDITKVTKALELQSCKNQLTDDEKQAKQDAAAEMRDKDEQIRLNRELNTLPALLTEYENEGRLLRFKINQQYGNIPIIDVINAAKQAKVVAGKKTPDLSEQKKNIDKLTALLVKNQNEVKALTKKQRDIKVKLAQIDKRVALRAEHQEAQSLRDQERAGYKATGEGIVDTLSTRNQSNLEKTIQDQKKILQAKCRDYMQAAEALNYATFIDRLDHLRGRFVFSAAESEALRICIKLVRQHLQQEQDVLTIKESIGFKEADIAVQSKALRDAEAKLARLKKDIPALSNKIAPLSAQSKHLKTLLDKQNLLYSRLYNSSLLTTAFTCLFSIPLVLTYYGVIPAFLTPIALYFLVASPPALLLLTTIGLVIAALVFNNKIQNNNIAYQANEQLLKSNTATLKSNTQNLHALEGGSIPALKKQLAECEAAKKTLETSLISMKNQAEQTLQKAKEIEPISFAQSRVLSTTGVSMDEMQDAEDEETDELSMGK